MTTPLVSVLMTSFNRERYIADAIESVLAQTFTDFELVVVDDASSDRSVEIARAYERRDPRVRVVVNARNLGDYPNRNHAATLARGRLLKYHDSDDIMYGHCLDVMVSMLLSEPDAAFGLSTGAFWPGGPCPMLLTPRLAYQREFFGNGAFMGGPACAIFHARWFRELGGFPLEGTHSDAIFWLRACAKVNCLLLPADLFWYRIHSEQELVKRGGGADGLRLFEIVWRQLGDESCPLTESERRQARINLLYKLVVKVYRDFRARQWTRGLERVRSAHLSLGEWATYLRPPRRDLFAGSPRTADGDYLIPRMKSIATSGAQR